MHHTTAEPETEEARIKDIGLNEQPLTFPEWQEIINENFPECAFAAEVALSVIAQILITDVTNPFALVLVDVPSAGKTITINFFTGIDELTYSTDNFTPASFVSNAANVATEKLKSVDMLPRIRYRMLLIRDLGPIFGQRDDDLLKSMGILTRVLDGEGYQNDSGVHGKREYVGDYLFMLLAGSPPIQPKVWKLMGNLGSRLFFLNMRTPDKTDKALADQLTNTAYKSKELICREATKDFLHTLWATHPVGIEWQKQHESPELLQIIVRCARLLARLRGTINVWQERSEDGVVYSYNSPVIEKPDRINQWFYNLCRGHALICDREYITLDDIRLIIELAIDSAPLTRSQLLRALIDYGGSMTTTDIEQELNCAKGTAGREMETLKILKIARLSTVPGNPGDPEKIITLTPDFEWFLSDECKAIRAVPPKPAPSQNNPESEDLVAAALEIFGGHIISEDT